MLLYLSLFVILFLLNFVFKEKKYQKSVFIIISIALVLLVGLRKSTVGNDSANYAYYYSYFGKMSLWESLNNPSRFELGYTLYCSILYKINSSYTFLFMVSALISMAPVLYAMYIYSDNPLFSLSLFIGLRYYTSYMNILRYEIAFGFAVIAFLLIMKGRKILPLIFIVIGVTFHTVMIVSLLFYGIYYINFNKKLIFSLICTGIIMFVAIDLLLRIVLAFFPQYSYYVNSIFFGSNNLANYLSLFLLFAYLALLPFTTFLSNVVEQKNIDVVFTKTIFIACFFALIACKVSLIDRVTICFSFFSVIYLANLLKYVEKDIDRLLIKLGVGLVAGAYLFITLYYRPEWNDVLNYKFFWQ